jgi:hypothetical protein
MGAVSIFAAGIAISGCVFFIRTDGGGFGGSGNKVMRAVSFFGATGGVGSY